MLNPYLFLPKLGLLSLKILLKNPYISYHSFYEINAKTLQCGQAVFI